MGDNYEDLGPVRDIPPPPPPLIGPPVPSPGVPAPPPGAPIVPPNVLLPPPGIERTVLKSAQMGGRFQIFTNFPKMQFSAFYSAHIFSNSRKKERKNKKGIAREQR
ncbi:unnamed protein product [Gongylonema pulchrum]|uniref:Uncharacterized protein n=1 Tax=Gongylonema pulchrum TaxID=637853 RepID=A0A183DD71_9BILA|nr:unnamed protein product [Gongylonema pulchrum]